MNWHLQPVVGMMGASSPCTLQASTHVNPPKQRSRRPPGTPLPGQRPLQGLDQHSLSRQFEAALSAGDGLGGAHCVHEWWMRGAFPQAVEAALERLWQHAADTVPEWMPMRYVDWLPTAYEVAGRFAPAGRGRTHLYLVLLDYSDSRPDPYGVYVGISRYRPAERFDQHKAGLRAAGSVMKRGLEVLTGPVLHLQSLPRAEAERIEEQLAEALRDAGLFVKGGH
jgi:hypothetical protein